MGDDESYMQVHTIPEAQSVALIGLIAGTPRDRSTQNQNTGSPLVAHIF